MTCVIVRKNGKWCGFGDELCEPYRLTSESSSEALHPDASEARVARVTALLDHVMSFDASRMKRQGRPFFFARPCTKPSAHDNDSERPHFPTRFP